MNSVDQVERQREAAPACPPNSTASFAKFGWRELVLWASGAVAAFHLAYGVPSLSPLILVYLFCLVQLARAETGRQAFYGGLSVGFLTVAGQLGCFWTIFGPSAIALWFVLAFWIGLFAGLARACRKAFGENWGSLLVPFLWTGIEYFRSELYYLRFSWLNVGYSFSGSPLLPFCSWLGVYGAGFVGILLVILVARLKLKRPIMTAVPLAALAIVILLLRAFGVAEKSMPASAKEVLVAGAQIEFGTPAEVLSALDKLIEAEPKAELLVLSEYTFDGPVPQPVKRWCSEHKKYLVVGGKDPAPGSNFYDTAFVVGPTGEIVFRQVKSVPIQFFKDGLPATNQSLWDSPWGRIGLCVCYDLSYSRVTDRLVRLGAQALIVPAMDATDWGRHQHELHARVAPIRAAEYGVPIFRLASSGISQLVDRFGQVTATAVFPGQYARLSGRLSLAKAGSLPWDRWLAPFASGLTGMVILYLTLKPFFRGRAKQAASPPAS